MPIVKCECKECKFYDDKLCCCTDVVELKTYGQCVEGIKIELNKALEEQRMAINMAIAKQKAELDRIEQMIEQKASVVPYPYPYYNTYLGGGEDI